MAKRYVIELIDDLTGEPIPDGSGETIEFSLNGVDYSIDLSSENAERFQALVGEFIAKAERVGGRQRRRTKVGASAASPARNSEQTRAVREWAAANGYEVADRGRIPAHIQKAFDAAH